MFVVISDMSSGFFLDSLVFGIQISHVNCKYSLTESLFTLIWKSSLHIFISESDFLPLNTNNTSFLYIVIPWIYCCISQIGKILLGPQENLIRICLLLGIFFNTFPIILRIHGIQTYNQPPKPTGCRLSE